MCGPARCAGRPLGRRRLSWPRRPRYVPVNITEPAPGFDDVRDYLTGLQDRICAAIEAADGGAASARTWLHAATEGGGGRTRILREARCSSRRASASPMCPARSCRRRRRAARPELAGASWRAVGVSLVFHPRNPYVPTTHANVRHFRAVRDGETVAWWFGGGFDLTPVLSVRRGRAALAPHRARHCASRSAARALRRAQALVRRVLLPQAPQRDPRRRRHVLRRPARGLRTRLRLPARGRRWFPRRLPADRRTPPRHAVWRARARSSSCTGAAATSSSTWCSTAARCSACNRAGAPSRS